MRREHAFHDLSIRQAPGRGLYRATVVPDVGEWVCEVTGSSTDERGGWSSVGRRTYRPELQPVGPIPKYHIGVIFSAKGGGGGGVD